MNSPWNQEDDQATLYCRSYLVTLGLICLALPFFVWVRDGAESDSWPTVGWILFFGTPLFGLVLLLVAAIASPKRIVKWADSASTHEASIFILVLAFPVYLILKLVSRFGNKER